jgi:hypothetical protein
MTPTERIKGIKDDLDLLWFNIVAGEEFDKHYKFFKLFGIHFVWYKTDKTLAYHSSGPYWTVLFTRDKHTRNHGLIYIECAPTYEQSLAFFIIDVEHQLGIPRDESFTSKMVQYGRDNNKKFLSEQDLEDLKNWQ